MAEKKAQKKIALPQAFSYEYVDKKGNLVKGEIAALSIPLAKATLRQQGINPSKIKKKSKSLFKSAGVARIKSMDIAVLTRQMATMSQAGIPLVQSLGVLMESTDHTGVKHLLEDIRQEVESGTSFSDALRKHPRYFDNLFCSLLQAGELSGSLDTMLIRIAVYKEKTESLKRKIKKAMYYPATVVTIAILVSCILLLKVVPTFKELFKGFGASLPQFTLFVLGISDFLQDNLLGFILGSVGIGILFGMAYRRSAPLRHSLERFTLKIPVFGPLVRKTAVARFARTLSTTFAAGVPLPDALEAIANATGNIVYQTAILAVREGVTGGQQMRVAMRLTNVFPPIVIQMVGIGEESGSLEEMLSKVATIYEEEVDTAVDGLATLLEPIIMVILGVIVGGLVIAMYLPIFKMGSIM